MHLEKYLDPMVVMFPTSLTLDGFSLALIKWSLMSLLMDKNLVETLVTLTKQVTIRLLVPVTTFTGKHNFIPINLSLLFWRCFIPPLIYIIHLLIWRNIHPKIPLKFIQI